MPRPCSNDHPPSPATCHLCKLVETREDYRRLWGESPATYRPSCRFRGAFREVRDCKSCNKGVSQDTLHECSKYGLCSEVKSHADANACHACPDYSAVDPVEFYPGVLDPIPDPEMRPKPRGWACRPEVRARHVWALKSLLGAPVDRLRHKNGRGVVICGGGKYAPMIRASLEMLKRHAPHLPVEVWHRGAEEPFDTAQECRIVDSTQCSHRILRGWESKTVALLHSRFETALFLDADCYPVADPTALLDLAEVAGFVSWGDLTRNHGFVGWDWFGVEPELGQSVPSVQGGQFAIHFPKFAKPFMLAHWLNQHSDYSYHHPNDRPKEWHAYGDQDCWRVALALSQSGHCHLGPARWEHPAFVCELAGEPLLVHRCQGKAFADKYEVTDHLPGDREFWEAFARTGLRS